MQGSADEQDWVQELGWHLSFLYMGKGMMGIRFTNRFYQNVFWNVASETIKRDFN